LCKWPEKKEIAPSETPRPSELALASGHSTSPERVGVRRDRRIPEPFRREQKKKEKKILESFGGAGAHPEGGRKGKESGRGLVRS